MAVCFSLVSVCNIFFPLASRFKSFGINLRLFFFTFFSHTSHACVLFGAVCLSVVCRRGILTRVLLCVGFWISDGLVVFSFFVVVVCSLFLFVMLVWCRVV